MEELEILDFSPLTVCTISTKIVITSYSEVEWMCCFFCMRVDLIIFSNIYHMIFETELSGSLIQ
jgi:hypothetical protein